MRSCDPMRYLAAATLAALAACADGGPRNHPDEADAAADPATLEDLKGDRATTALVFREVDPKIPMRASQRATVKAALGVLDGIAKRGTSGRQRLLAAETLARIAAGDVRIGAIEAARGTDLWHMCLDLSTAMKCPARPPADPAWAGDATLRATLLDELDGYTWGNRLYFRLDTSIKAADLASTLVHEVNHVLNRSECSYYADYFAHEVEPTLAWLEEYRAFATECVLARGTGATAARCDTWAATQIEDRGYDLVPDLALLLDDTSAGTRAIAASLFADDGAFGFFVPKPASWPDAFPDCASTQ